MIVSAPLAAQHWQLLRSVALENPVRMIKRDHTNNLYINDLKGNVIKLDTLGKSLAEFAPVQYGQITTMEPWPSLRLFLYYENTQQYIFLDRYLAGTAFNEFPASIGFARIAAPSSDNQIWIIDDRSFSLIKYEFNFDQITLEIPLSQLPENEQLQPYQLKEYQNRLYIGDVRRGILVFDNIGNFLKTIPMPDALAFDFSGDNIYYIHEDSIHYEGIYVDTRKSHPLPASRDLKYTLALVMGHKIALVSGRYINFFRYSP